MFRSKFMVPSGLPRPVPVIVRQFTKEQMSKVIAEKLKERQARDDLDHEKDVEWEDEVSVKDRSLLLVNFLKLNTPLQLTLDFLTFLMMKR